MSVYARADCCTKTKMYTFSQTHREFEMAWGAGREPMEDVVRMGGNWGGQTAYAVKAKLFQYFNSNLIAGQLQLTGLILGSPELGFPVYYTRPSRNQSFQFCHPLQMCLYVWLCLNGRLYYKCLFIYLFTTVETHYFIKSTPLKQTPSTATYP